MMAPQKQVVLVTGFGPFGTYEVNSSWVAVKEMSSTGLEIKDVNLVVKEIPVEYDIIDKKVPQLWKKYNPVLVVHVGVSGVANTITLEQYAHNDGYNRNDNRGKCPKHFCCKEEGSQTLKSTINMKEIVECQHLQECNVQAVTSNDPGRYLCDYIYYTSLSMKKNHVAFIHVPPLNKPFNGKQLADGLRVVIQAMLEQVSTKAA
nr:pyroglutamyl-peptidase 1 [Ciona intestinalis]|eukprot:XP_004227022.2 pyroglutamyl-peptidase 1 [Ciona intestinalis]